MSLRSVPSKLELSVNTGNPVETGVRQTQVKVYSSHRTTYQSVCVDDMSKFTCTTDDVLPVVKDPDDPLVINVRADLSAMLPNEIWEGLMACVCATSSNANVGPFIGRLVVNIMNQDAGSSGMYTFDPNDANKPLIVMFKGGGGAGSPALINSSMRWNGAGGGEGELGFLKSVVPEPGSPTGNTISWTVAGKTATYGIDGTDTTIQVNSNVYTAKGGKAPVNPTTAGTNGKPGGKGGRTGNYPYNVVQSNFILIAGENGQVSPQVEELGYTIYPTRGGGKWGGCMDYQTQNTALADGEFGCGGGGGSYMSPTSFDPGKGGPGVVMVYIVD